jgi:WD40 repeat protein
LNVKYIETGCNCEVTGNTCQCGIIKASTNNPQIIAYTVSDRKKLGIFITELDYHYKLDTEVFEDFAVSPDGKYLALTGVSGNMIQVIDLRTRKVWTEFKRGLQTKKSLCLGFVQDWFGIVYESKNYATFHLFEMKEKKEN